ncbi:hypothetical protein A1F97_00553 [Pyrenophora tritici-repentis]|nr:hypothetical protein A1F97_00553 [Pyrenophora tritici-repentis]
MAGCKELSPYSLDAELNADSSKENCFVLDVGHDKDGDCVSSAVQVAEVVEDFRFNAIDTSSPITKLYIVGEWHPVLCKGKGRATEKDVHVEYEDSKYSKLEKEHRAAGEAIAKLVEHMPALKELTWISGLPFMPVVWEKLPTSLTKLVLDLGQPMKVHHDVQHEKVIEYNSYITANEMKPLACQTQLKELRLLRIQDSMQSVVWETIFRNKSEDNMRVADLQMAAAPLVRTKHWHKAEDVVGLTVPKGDFKEKEYKGIEGKGQLHYSFGTGEYLDDFCMRKARLAAALDESIPLPLWSLKLDGFVVDYLPFEHELSRIVLLTCGPNCIDSGLRAPKTPRSPLNKWSKIVNNAVSHCLIQWPNWTGVFDDRGDQRDAEGDIVPQEVGLSTPALDMLFSPVRLTKESLQIKELRDALDAFKAQEEESPMSLGTSLGVGPSTSVASTRGSDLHGSDLLTPVGEQADRSSPKSSEFDTSSPCGASLILVDSTTTVESVLSNDSGFDEATPVDVDGVADDVSKHAADGLKHEVRRSMEQLSGSSF